MQQHFSNPSSGSTHSHDLLCHVNFTEKKQTSTNRKAQQSSHASPLKQHKHRRAAQLLLRGSQTLPWRRSVLLARQVKGLGPGAGAAACIRRPLPVGVTVRHTQTHTQRRQTWRGSLTTATSYRGRRGEKVTARGEERRRSKTADSHRRFDMNSH